MITIIDEARLQIAKRAFSVRNVPLSSLRTVDDRTRRPRPGDIVLARVIEIGRLQGLQAPSGRKQSLYPDDEVILVYGHRYAPDAYEADCPADLRLCDLGAAGGLAGTIRETNAKFASDKSPPTLLKPVGLFVDTNDEPLNLAAFPGETASPGERAMPVISVFGASMNAGKTTMAGGIIKGLTAQGLKVGAAKVTGTCSGGDLFTFEDAGAVKAVDFTDAGLASTYREEIDNVIGAAETLLAGLEKAGCDVAVVEIADGVFQQETAELLRNERFRALVDHWTFAADSAPSILTGLNLAQSLDLEIVAVSGSVTASPLAVREAAAFVDVPVLSLSALCEGTEPKRWLAPTAPLAGLATVFSPQAPQALAS
ncbi:MAG: DUF1611 domain-containing protein [Pseudomonadota bacterium]